MSSLPWASGPCGNNPNCDAESSQRCQSEARIRQLRRVIGTPQLFTRRALSRFRIYDPQLIIYGLDEVLLHAEVFLSGLDRRVAQEHLDLLEVSA